MKYCKKCLNIDTRPNIVFTDEGLCPPCANYVHPEDINWDERMDKLNEIKSFAKRHNSSGYDCIIGVSGGKDSTRQALFVKENLGLKPLLVSLNYPPQQISKNGVDNLSNLINQGFDCVNISCSPQIWRDAMKDAFFKFGNWAKATELALFASVPRFAIAYQIPLIWWGENAAAVLGELGVQGKDASDGNRLKYSNTLQGGNIDWLLSIGFTKKDILQYIYPSDDEMNRAEIRIVFLDYFMKEFSHSLNGTYSALRGLSIRAANPIKNPELYGTSMLDEDFINVNMFIRYLKFGFGRTTDIVNEEIRYGRMSREIGVDLVEKYDGNYDYEIIKQFCQYIGVTIDEFWGVVDRFVNPLLFIKKGTGHYERRFKVGLGV
jgi:N-acetyl sugar amidotransferase